MRLTPQRWLLVTLLGGALGLALALPNWGDLTDRYTFYDQRERPLRALRREVRAERIRFDQLRREAVRALVRQSLAAAPVLSTGEVLTWIPQSPLAADVAAHDSRAVHVLGGIRQLSDSITRIRSRLQASAAPPPGVVLIQVPAAVSSGRGPLGLQPNRFGGATSRWFVFPDSLKGAACAATFGHDAMLMAERQRNWLGPCFWFAAFGAPGRTMREFLQQQEYAGFGEAGRRRLVDDPASVAMPAFLDELALMRDMSWDYAAAHRALVCLARGGPICTESVMARYLWNGRRDPVFDATLPWSYNLAWDRSELSVPSMATDLGAERFAVLWRSDKPFSDAFADAAGRSFDDYVRQTYLRTYGSSYHAGPWPTVAAAAILVLIASLCLALLFADRRRPSVA